MIILYEGLGNGVVKNIDFSDILIKEASVVKIPLVCYEVRRSQRGSPFWAWQRSDCEQYRSLDEKFRVENHFDKN